MAVLRADLTPADRDRVKASLELAIPESSERFIERIIDQEGGSTKFDRKNAAWCRVVARDIPNDIFPPFLTAGVSTEAPFIVPQHHDQHWVNEVLVPLIAPCLVSEAQARPDALDRPLWSFVDADESPTLDLADYWVASPIGAQKQLTRSKTRALVYVPTLREAIQNLVRAGVIAR